MQKSLISLSVLAEDLSDLTAWQVNAFFDLKLAECGIRDTCVVNPNDELVDITNTKRLNVQASSLILNITETP